ncbi:MAG: HIT family protein [archaeon]
MEDCVFCKIVAGEIPCHKICESEDFVVIEDVSPKVEGHLLVVSKKHCDNFLSLSSELYGEMLVLVKDVVKKLELKDFNLVLNNGKLAGQVIFHFHLHILPRRINDGFKFGV